MQVGGQQDSHLRVAERLRFGISRIFSDHDLADWNLKVCLMTFI
jgi:hypothetical protein